MGIYATKPKWQQALGGVVEFCVKSHVHPNVFTYGALALALVAAIALALAGSDPAILWLVPPCILARLLFNLLDGQVARARGLADRWGEVKNESGDRLADAAIFLAFCFGGYTDARLAALVAVLVVLISYLGILGKATGGMRLYDGVFGKGDRMISLTLFTLWVLTGRDPVDYNIYLILAACAAVVTIVQRMKSLHEHAKSLR